MLDIFSGLRLVVRRRVVNIDNAIFRCHWFFTSTLLVSFSLIITARQYVGQPIECHSVDKIPDSLLNSYCWVQSTFNVPQACNGQPGVDVPYPCIDNTRGREIKVYAYYQWVGIVLFIQGLMFHLPYYLWKLWENGLIKAITGGLRVAVLNEHERAKKKEIVVEYIHDHLGCHKRYALKYFLCEFICLINLLGQLWATNKFFDGQFMRYGLEVLQYSSSSISGQFAPTTQAQISSTTTRQQNQTATLGVGLGGASSRSSLTLPLDTQPQVNTLFNNYNPAAPLHHQKQSSSANGGKQQVDPMTLIFPRMSKCRYHDFGSSGDIQAHDALCILPLNIINEKIYIALWFWFFILAILTLIVIIYRLFAIISENVRCKGLISRCKLSSERDIRLICRHCDVGDWFLFYMIAENVDPLIMREIVASIAIKITNHLQLKEELKAQLEQDADREKLRLLMDEQYRMEAAAAAAAAAAATAEPITSYLENLSGNSNNNRNNNNNNSTTTTAHENNSPTDPSATRVSIVDQMPMVKKLKKRLYNKRLWSIDLGSSELRQHLFGGGGQQHDRHGGGASSGLATRGSVSGLDMRYMDEHSVARTSMQFVASAPPISEMPLNGAPPPLPLRRTIRRGSLTRQTSSSSTSGVSSVGSSPGSFVMEMSGLARWPPPPAGNTSHHEHDP